MSGFDGHYFFTVTLSSGFMLKYLRMTVMVPFYQAGGEHLHAAGYRISLDDQFRACTTPM